VPETKYPLSLVVRAVDKATGPLARISAQIARTTAPIRARLAGIGAASGQVGSNLAALSAKVAAIGGVAGFALYRATKSAVEAGDELATVADRLGLTVDAFAQLQFAAAQADVEQSQFTAAMDAFNKSVGQAKAGTGKLLGFLQNVSPALAQQVRGAKSTEEAFGLMTSAFEKVEDPSKRAALAAAAFGAGNLQMGQFLGQGSKAIDEQRKKFLALAGSQEALARRAGDLDNAMRETEVAFLGARNALAVEFFPVFTELSKSLRDFLAANRGGLAKWARDTGSALSAWVQSGGLQRLTTSLREIAKAVGFVIEKIGGFRNAIIGVAALNLASAIAPLVQAFAAIGPSMLPFLVAAAPFIAALTGISLAVYQLQKNWSDLKEAFGTWDGIKTSLGGIASTIADPFSFAEGQEMRRKELAVEEARQRMAGVTKTEARVAVNFANLPRGARVTPANGNTAELDLGVGYSMVTP
jgi:curved DNA-binding protein CbpA